MPLAEPAVRASVLAIMPEFLVQRRIEPGPLLAAAGLDKHAIGTTSPFVPLKVVMGVFERAAARLDDPAFGLEYARNFPIGGAGLLGHLLMSAPTVKDALGVTAHYLAVHMTMVRATFEMQGTDGCFSWKWPITLTGGLTQYTAFIMGVLTLRLRLATGPEWYPASVGFQHREASDLTTYRQIFGSRLLFDRAVNSIVVDGDALSKPMPPIMTGLFETVQDLGNRVLREQAPTTDYASLAQAEIANRLDAERAFDLETIAAALTVTPRALQWRLAQAGTTYENIIRLTRILRAEHMLRDTSHPMTTIAALLGFSEHSAFTRWTKRQFGLTPKALRRRLRGQSSDQQD